MMTTTASSTTSTAGICGERCHPNDDSGHGTHVAGTIAAVRDNGIGVAGVADNARIHGAALSADGNGYTSTLLLRSEYAIDNGTPISNNSWGGGGFNTALSSLIALNADTISS